MRVTQELRRRAFRLLRLVPRPVLERVVRLNSSRYTLGAACLIEEDGQVLVLRAAYRRNWGLPGGLIDRREAPETGARREVREEVGLDVELIGEPIVLVDVRHRLVDFLYRARLAAGATAADARPASSEIEEVRWIASSDIDRLAGDTRRLEDKLRLYAEAPSGRVVVESARRARGV